STFDIRHVATVNYAYQLPFGSGKPIGKGWTGITQTLLGGWETTGIARFSSGPPFQVVNGFDRSHDLRTGANRADRVDLRPGFTNNPVTGDPNRWFDPNAFALQPDGTYGSLGRNTLRGPGLISVDLGLTKKTKLTEQVNAQFRFEAFNILNRPNFAVPPIQALTVFLDASGTINSLAGRIASTTTSARQLQFALRLEF
ncbi:MAG TPA: carboxypeptidase regulatory-like domain-containing protein, partial [Terriglobia bacterium]|nr:carboxypeptidase regulatory-like domain-containing protein [Terriglobia bacterium]